MKSTIDYTITVENIDMINFLKSFLNEFPANDWTIHSTCFLLKNSMMLTITSTENILNAIELKNLDIQIVLL